MFTSTSTSVHLVSKMFAQVHRGQSLPQGVHSLTFVFIVQKFCMGSGICLFQAPFCAYILFINDTLGVLKHIVKNI